MEHGTVSLGFPGRFVTVDATLQVVDNTISSFGVAKVNFLSERTLSCIDSDNAREETRRWRS